MKEDTIETLREKRDEQQTALRARIDKWVKDNTQVAQAEIDSLTKKIVELLP